MTPHKQLIEHDPANGRWGDCHRTALACLLDLHPSEVPHFMNGGGSDDWREREREWLAERGLSSFMIAYDADLDVVLGCMAAWNPDCCYLLGGESPRGVNHTVVYRGGCLACDPHPDDGGLVGPCDDGYYWLTILTPRSG